jgi:hypothetical protein
MVGSDLTRKHWTMLEMLASDKHSSLLEILVNYDRKSCIKLGPSRETMNIILYYFLSPVACTINM